MHPSTFVVELTSKHMSKNMSIKVLLVDILPVHTCMHVHITDVDKPH